MKRLTSRLSVIGLAACAAFTFASMPAHGSTVAVKVAGPVITSPDITYGALNQSVTVTGTATPKAVVALHFHKAGTPANDYSIVRNVQASTAGRWSRSFVLNPDYRVFATVGTGNPHSKTVLFTSAIRPTALGGTQDTRAELDSTTIGVQFAAIDNAATANNDFEQPAVGDRYVAVKACVRNRGPATYDDYPEFVIGTSTGETYGSIYVTVNDGPDLDATNVAPGELRCGQVVFEVPNEADVTTLFFTADDGSANQTLRWTTP
jgi:hypothetical protein